MDDGDAGAATPSVTVKVAEPPIENQAPTANAGANQTGADAVNEGDTVTFDGSGSTDPDTDGEIINYRWEFGDGTSSDGSTPVQTHIYPDDPDDPNDDTFTVRLIVTDNEGGTGDSTIQVEVKNVAPVVVTGTVAPADEGDQVRITGTFTDAGSEDTHSATIAWGDGTQDSITTFRSPFARTHVYTDNSPPNERELYTMLCKPLTNRLRLHKISV